MTKSQLDETVYKPIGALKQKFYECQSNEEWQELKKQLKALLSTAEESMDATFYEKYSQGVINSITKIYSFKQKQFNKADKKQYVPQPKVTYLLQPELAEALINYLNVRTQILKQTLNNETNETTK